MCVCVFPDLKTSLFFIYDFLAFKPGTGENFFLHMSKSTTLSCHLTTKAGLAFNSLYLAKSVPKRDGAIKEDHNFVGYMGL
jgi:hypothetical protein